MSGPTREELERLGDVLPAVARSIDLRRRTEEGLTPEDARLLRAWYDDLCTAGQLCRSYPLPPEDGERAEYAGYVETAARNTACVSREPGDQWEDLAAKLHRAAALLRQPPSPPAAGVSKADVLRMIRVATNPATDRWTRFPADLLADIEALPEAALPPHAVHGHWFDLNSWICECGYMSGKDSALCTKCWRPNRPPVLRVPPAVTVPPSGVDRELLTRVQLILCGEICMPDPHMVLPISHHPDCQALRDLLRAIPEAKP